LIIRNSDPYFSKVSSSKLGILMRSVDYSITYLQDEVGSCSTSEFQVMLQNMNGSFVLPNETTTQSAIDAAGLSFNSRFEGDFLNPNGISSYPINAVTYFIYRSHLINVTSCSKAIGMYIFAQTMFGSLGNSIVKSSLKFPLADSSVGPKIFKKLGEFKCDGVLVSEFLKPQDYTPIIFGSVFGFVGVVLAIFFFILLVIVVIVAVFVVDISIKKRYYENLVS
jgi:hypothetical protein